MLTVTLMPLNHWVDSSVNSIMPSQTGRTIRHILHFGNGYAIVYIPPAIRAFLQADIGDAIEYSEEEEFG